MSAALTPFKRSLLAELASRRDSRERSPATLSLALNADLQTVLKTVKALHEIHLLECEGFKCVD